MEADLRSYVRFDHTPGYTPSKPDEEQFAFSRDCFSFAAVAISCVAGRVIEGDADIAVVFQEATLPSYINAILVKCLSVEPSDRPPLGSFLKEQIEQAEAEAELGQVRPLNIRVFLRGQVVANLEKRLELAAQVDIERFVLAELSEVCGIRLKNDENQDELTHVELIGASWKFDGVVAGRCHEALHVTRASEIGAALASELRETSAVRPLSFSFVRPKDAEKAGLELQLLIAETLSAQRAATADREVRASNGIQGLAGLLT